MAVFVTSTSAARRHGVFAIERTPPATVRATGSATSVIIEQFPWGPSQTLTEPTGMRNMLDTIAPPGMTRTGAGYLSVIRKGWPLLKFIRVLGSTAVKASCVISSVTPVALFTLTLKYPGTAGNSVTATIATASDGDSNHFNLSVTVTGATGTTTDKLENLNYSGTGSNSAPDLTKTLLLGTITVTAQGLPVLGSTTFSLGTDGTIDATTYVGTAGTADKGLAKMESDRTVDGFFVGNPGDTIRAAVNLGLAAHADYMTDRVAYINGNSGLTMAATQTAAAISRSQRVVFVDQWVNITDDTDGTTRLVSGASWAASVASQLPPSTSIAWKSDKVQRMLSGIVDLESDRGEAAASNTELGIVTFNREESGGFTFEAGVTTIAPTTPAKRNLTRTRMGHYIARSIVTSLRSSTDAPNVPVNQQDEICAVDKFLGQLKRNATTDPNNLPHILNYAIADVEAANSQTSLDAGEFSIPIDVKTSSAQEKIFISMNFGENVTVSTQL